MSSNTRRIRYRVFLLELDTCNKTLIGYFSNRFDAIKRANGYHLLSNEAVIVQQLMNDDSDMDKWYTVYSKVKRR